MSTWLHKLASIQRRTSLVKFARSPRTDPPGAIALLIGSPLATTRSTCGPKRRGWTGTSGLCTSRRRRRKASSAKATPAKLRCLSATPTLTQVTVGSTQSQIYDRGWVSLACFGKLWRARSRLYQRRILQPNTHFSSIFRNLQDFAILCTAPS